MSTNELVPNKETMGVLALMAKSAHLSSFYKNLGGEAGIMAIMLLARELDISPMQALSGGIWNIQGRVVLSSRMMNMKIRQAGHKLDIQNMGAEGCRIAGTRKDTGETMTVSFTKEDALRAGVLGKDVWHKFPREMYFARALSLLARMLFPDVIGNCYVEHEISDDSESDGRPQIVTPPVFVETAEQLAEKISESQINELRELGDRRFIILSAGELGIHIKNITDLSAADFEKIKQHCIMKQQTREHTAQQERGDGGIK